MSNSAKFTLYFFVILSLATGVMWFVGGNKKEYSTKVTISAPASRVYRYLSEPDLLNEWSNEIVEIEPFESERQNVGAMAEVLVERDGKQVAMRQQVIKFDMDKMISLQRTNDFLKTTAIFRLEGNNSKTELTYRVKESRLGISRILGFFSRSDRQEVIKQEIRELKQYVESNLGKDLGELPRFPWTDGIEPVDKPENQSDLESDTEAESDFDVDPEPTSQTTLTDSKTSSATGGKQQNRPDQAFGDQ